MKLADILLKVSYPSLVVMCGLPATGKSSIARFISQNKGHVIISSDVLRPKVLEGLNIFEDSVASDFSKRLQVYERMFEEAALDLAKGKGVILDATFIKQSLRLRAAEIAKRYSVPLIILYVTCNDDTALSRIAARATKAYESNALSESAYLANKRNMEAIDIPSIISIVGKDRFFSAEITTDADNIQDWSVKVMTNEY